MDARNEQGFIDRLGKLALHILRGNAQHVRAARFDLLDVGHGLFKQLRHRRDRDDQRVLLDQLIELAQEN